MATNLEYKSTKNDGYLSREELIIKAQMEQWIYDVWKKADLEKKLQKAFEKNAKSHVKTLSEL